MSEVGKGQALQRSVGGTFFIPHSLSLHNRQENFYFESPWNILSWELLLGAGIGSTFLQDLDKSLALLGGEGKRNQDAEKVTY